MEYEPNSNPINEKNNLINQNIYNGKKLWVVKQIKTLR